MISFACLCFFFFDCSISGGGHYVALLGITPRMIAAAIALIGAVPVVLKNIKKYVKTPLLILFSTFLVYLVICAVRGVAANNRMNVLLSDLKGFAWLFLVPVCLALIDSRVRFEKVVNVIIAGSVVQAIMVLGANVLSTLCPGFVDAVHDPMLRIMIGSVSPITDKIFRVFLRSSPYMVLTVGALVYRQVHAQKLNWKDMILTALCLVALLFSYTRSVYGCLAVVLFCALAAVVILCRKAFWKCLRFLALSVALAICLTFAQELILGGSYVNFAYARTFKQDVSVSKVVEFRNDAIHFIEDTTGLDLPEDDLDLELEKMRIYLQTSHISDAVRGGTEEELIAIFLQNPVFGSGLGASAPCREDGLDEYFYLDMLARTGILGLVLYLLPFAYICICCLKRRNVLSDFVGGCGVLCGLVGFWAITWFNPWMNAALGVACYALCSAIPQNLENKNIL